MSKIYYKLDEISKISDRIISVSNSKTICFKGNLGSGKTTLIQSLVKSIGSVDLTRSPSFGIVNSYFDSNDVILAYHFDCYRLESIEEALDFGIDEYFKSEAWIFIEWPEVIENILPNFRTEIELIFHSENERLVTINEIR